MRVEGQRELLEAYGRLAAAGREEGRVRAELSAGRARALEAAAELKRQLVFGQQLQEEHKAGTPTPIVQCSLFIP